MQRTANAALKENKELVKTFNEWTKDGRIKLLNEYYVWQQQ